MHYLVIPSLHSTSARSTSFCRVRITLSGFQLFSVPCATHGSDDHSTYIEYAHGGPGTARDRFPPRPPRNLYV